MTAGADDKAFDTVQPWEGPLEVWAVDTVRCRNALLTVERNEPRLPGPIGSSQWPETERTVAHIALRLLLERACGRRVRDLAFDVSPSGKPSLPGSAVAFSLSHCPGMALVAIDESGPLGIDVERVDRPLTSLLTRRARIEALAAILSGGRRPSLPGAAAALQGFVRMEAVAKADGSGIAVLLSRLGVIGTRIPDEEAAARAASLMPPGGPLLLDDIDAGEGFVAALARPSARGAPRVLRFPTFLGAAQSPRAGDPSP